MYDMDKMTEYMDFQELGKWGEELAKSYLQEQGFEVLFHNYHTEYGEIDLIANNHGRLHFVEVKTRRTKRFGYPEEAITPKKLTHMIDSASVFMQSHSEFEGDWQIDVIAIQISTENGPPEIRCFANVQ